METIICSPYNGASRIEELTSFSKDSVQFSSVAQSCPTLWDPVNHSTPGLLFKRLGSLILRVLSSSYYSRHGLSYDAWTCLSQNSLHKLPMCKWCQAEDRSNFSTRLETLISMSSGSKQENKLTEILPKDFPGGSEVKLSASTAVGMGLILGRGTKTLHAVWLKGKKKEKKND